MEKNQETEEIFFGIFQLREQLYNYLDVIEADSHKVSHFLGYSKAKALINNKRALMKRTERRFWNLRHSDVRDEKLFGPLDEPWLYPKAFSDCTDRNEVILLLKKFEAFTMKWCHWFLAEEHISLDTSKFLLEVIQTSMDDLKLLDE